MTLQETLQGRKERIEQRLKQHGITEYSISFLRYLMFDDKEFATPYEVGCRIMILCAVVYSTEDPSKKEELANWLKKENIWAQASYQEQLFLEGEEEFEDEQLIDFSWQLEAAYILAWALNLAKDKPSPTGSATDDQLDGFFENAPSFGEELSGFLNNLSYRNTEEIFEENIFYELTTAYFRDHVNEETSDIDRTVAYERHRALNWLRRFSGITDWEETDTST